MNVKHLRRMRVVIALFAVISAIFMGVPSAQAQVTTASISGLVVDDKGEVLPGATVVAIHTPSGSKYGTVSNEKGRYNIQGVRVGGPFSITATFVGYKEQVKEGIFTALGAASNVDFKMAGESAQLAEIVITGNRSDIFSSDRTGAATTLGKTALTSLPTIGSRSINDFTKYNPQGNGRSFGGQDSRLNNFTIDGSVFNNGFGLGSEAQAGGRTGSTAISLDAIEELQVNVAPFDVRQSGFVGAGLNAVTRSGTNEVSGSVYHNFRNNNYVGTKARDLAVAAGTFNEKVTGFRVGAPIIKNKLFIFLNGESQSRVQPANAFVAQGSSTPGTATSVLKSDIEQLSAFMKSKFNYETGAYEGYDAPTNSDKFLARLDYNINQNHKFTVRYTFHNSKTYVPISNSTSAGNGNRITTNSLSFRNSGYFIKDNTSSIVTELNSTFKGKFSNNLIVSYNKQNEDREYAGPYFPTVDILKDNRTYISVGMDPFTPDNKLNYATFQATNNFTIFSGNHTFTLGANYEHFKSNNNFYPASNGVWIFNSLDDFYKSANGDKTIAPRRFQYRYSALPGGAEPLQVLYANKFDLYAQDEWQATRNLKVSYGIRAAIIGFGNTEALENTTISGLSFVDENNASYKINTGTLPSSKVLWEPRVGFNWDVQGDRTLQVRGGTGIFTGRPPYVWVSNQVGNNGILTGFLDPATAQLINYPFVADASVYRPATPTLPSTFDIAVTDPGYRFPQVWKTNIALDKKLPWNMVGSVEFLYNKNVSAVYYIDANLKSSTAKFSGPDQRDRFAGSASAARINANVSRAAVMKTTSQGANTLVTLKLERNTSKGLNFMLAYTRGFTKDLMSAGSIASGSWTGARSVNGNNQLGLSFSDNDIPHRLVGTLGYRIEYGGKLGGSTQVAIGYVGGTGASRFTYTYAGDMNGDGVNDNDLIYVPNRASELTFLPVTISGTTYTAEQQAQLWDKYIDQDPYLSTRRGQYAERNGGVLPWLNQYDLSFIQEFFIKVGKKEKRNTIQIRADILNFGNFLNSNWGVGQFVNNTRPLTAAGNTTAGVPQYRLSTQSIRKADGTSVTEPIQSTFQYGNRVGDVWNAQLGIRYIFN